MFDVFARDFAQSITTQTVGEPWMPALLASAQGYQEFALRFAGGTFDRGLYRVHDARSGSVSQRLIDEMFPQFAHRAAPFAFDWMGRQFALDRDRLENAEALILMLEPGTGAGLEIPLSFRAFHDQLGELREPALANGFFDQWSQANEQSLPLSFNVCVGYRVPLFLGGKDIVSNLEAIDLDVYWTLSGQLRNGSLHMNAGTSISDVSLKH